MRKFGSYEVLSAELAGNRQTRRTAARSIGIRTTSVIVREAHRADFKYTPRPGYLYVRSRAISSRCNDNFDEFPANEIEAAYHTFVGKPVFVNHANSTHRRTRGVIIDAALHKDTNADGSPDVWTEVLMEVDAVKFPKLAKAILAGHVDRTSMGCFLPGTPITMSNGIHLAIEDVLPENEVLTHDGNVATVTELMRMPHDGLVYDIRVYGQSHPLVTTCEHPLWVKKDKLTIGQARRKGVARTTTCICGETYPSAASLSAHLREARRREFVGEHGVIEVEQKPKWVEAWDITPGDWVLTPKFRPFNAVSSSSMAVLLGYYLAEGSVSQNGVVQWDFNESETEYVAEIVEALRIEGLKETGPYFKNGSVSIRCNNKSLAQHLFELGGIHCDGKVLAPEVFGWCIDHQRIILEKYFNGDGCYRANRVEAGTASKMLAEQLHFLAVRVGIPMTPPIKQHSPSAIDKLPKYVMQAVLEPNDKSIGHHQVRPEQDGQWRRVEAVSIKHYEGTVYNLDVDGDDSYVASDIAVHNCDVAFSVCSACGNEASSPSEYCVHIPKLKGHKYVRYNASLGRGVSEVIREICHGLKFFENSLLVEDPADPTAAFLGEIEYLGKESGQPAPGVSISDSTNSGRRNAKLDSDVFQSHRAQQSPDLSDLILSEDGLGVTFASGTPTLGDHISGVIGVGTKEPMTRVLAQRNITGMADNHFVRDRSNKSDVTVPMGSDTGTLSVGQRESAISTIGKDPTSPKVTSLGATASINLGEVSINLSHRTDPPAVSRISHEAQHTVDEWGFIHEATLDSSEVHETTPEDFHGKFEDAMKGNPYTHHVNHYSPEEIKSQGMKPLLSHGGKAGILIHDHGDGRVEGTGLFRHPDAPHGAGMDLFRHAIEHHGVNYAEAFEPHLTKMYESAGFKTTERLPFDRSLAQPGWDYKKFGEPSLAIMHRGEPKTAYRVDGWGFIHEARPNPEIEQPYDGEIGKYLYHHSPPENRQSILTHGLTPHDPQESSAKGSDIPSENTPKGVYLGPYDHIGSHRGHHDIWAVDTNNVHLRHDPDDHDNYWGFHYTQRTIPPESLHLIHKAGEPNAHEAAWNDVLDYAKSKGRDYLGDEQVGFEEPQADIDNAYATHGSHHPSLGRIFRGFKTAGAGLATPDRWQTPDASEPPLASMMAGAHQYRAARGLPADHSDYSHVMADKERHGKIAAAYEAMPEKDEAARPAFEAMRHEIGQQYHHLTHNMGVKVSFQDEDPYPSHHEMMADVRDNNHLKVNHTQPDQRHPFLTDDENDKFRAVHDAFGHIATGRAFDRHGEEAAWKHHSTMFSPLARGAMSTETRGQNATLIHTGKFPQQKMGVLPEHFWNDEAVGSTREGSFKVMADNSIMSPDEIAAAAAPDAPPESGGGAGKKPGGGGGMPGMPELGGGGGEAAGGASALEELAPLALAAAKMTPMETTHFKFHRNRKDPKGCPYCSKEEQAAKKESEPKTSVFNPWSEKQHKAGRGRDMDPRPYKLAYGETVAPPEVDTLREDICPVCGEHDSYNGDKCEVCGFIKPPSMFMDPDVQVAQNLDMRSDQQDENAAVPEGTGDLLCPACGSEFASAEEDNAEGEPHLAPAGQVEVDENESGMPAPDGGNQVEDDEPENDEEVPGAPSKKEKPAVGEFGEVPQDEDDEETVPGEEEEVPEPGQKGTTQEDELAAEQGEEQALEDEDAQSKTGYSEGDTCPACGKGVLEPAESIVNNDEEDDPNDEPVEDDEDEEDDNEEPDDKPSRKATSSLLDPSFIRGLLSHANR